MGIVKSVAKWEAARGSCRGAREVEGIVADVGWWVAESSEENR